MNPSLAFNSVRCHLNWLWSPFFFVALVMTCQTLQLKTNKEDLNNTTSSSSYLPPPLSTHLSHSLTLSFSLCVPECWSRRRSSGLASAHRGIASHHSVPAVVAHGAPAGTEGGKKGEEEVGSDGLRGHLRAEEREEKGPDRREERAMASKDTSAAGFVNVSREITGELEHEFFREVCFDLSLNPQERGRGGGEGGGGWEQVLRRVRLVFHYWVAL